MIYVIGGKGFVGSAVVRACERNGEECEIITHDTIKDFTGTECDILINANGNSKKFMSERDPLWDFDASVRSVRASLENIKFLKYVHLSSCDVYPDCSSPETTREDQLLDVTKQSAYGFHKYLAELCVMRHAKNWLIFRMGGFVGQGLKKNAIYDILQGGPLWLNPESELQFINVDEAADIIVAMALDKTTSGEIYNLCGNGVIKLSDVLSVAGRDVEVKAEAPKVKYEVSITKLLQETNVTKTEQAVISYVKMHR
jgi:nucleoside-diphosphate-sugar epimerase